MGNGEKVPILRPFLLYHMYIIYEILLGQFCHHTESPQIWTNRKLFTKMQNKKDDLAIEMSNNLDWKKWLPYRNSHFFSCLRFFDGWMFHPPGPWTTEWWRWTATRVAGFTATRSRATSSLTAEHGSCRWPTCSQLLAMLPPLKLNSNSSWKATTKTVLGKDGSSWKAAFFSGASC